MLKSYLKIAWRTITRNKTFAAINITGLAIGMAAALLIGIWVQNELSYDQFHTNENSLYKVYNQSTGAGQIYTWPETSGPVVKALKNDFPEVENTARIYWSVDRLFSYNDKTIRAKGNDVDKPFLTMFSFPLIKGDANHALDDVNSIVITEDLAKKLFGDKEPVNKIVKIDNKLSYKITGVLKNLPNNTDFDFSYLVSLAANENFYSNNHWDNYSYNTYVQLKPNANAYQFNNKIKNEAEKNSPGIGNRLFLYPLSKQHLYSNFENGKPTGGRIDVVRLLLIIAALVLLIACINFMNLSTAQSQKRAKEVGVRKVIGASKFRLIKQFLCESIVTAAIAGFISLIVIQLSLPAFNQLVGKSLSLNFNSIYVWLGFAAFIVFTGLLAGSYPAFYLSKFKPVKVLKGSTTSVKNPFNLRKILVVTQFSVAIVLIISTIIVYREIQFVQSRNKGYNINSLIEIPIEGDINKNYSNIKNELLNKGVITAMCKNSLGVTVDGATGNGLAWAGAPNNEIGYSRVGTYGDFAKTAGLQMIDGRDINIDDYPSDTTAVMLNEAAVKALQMKHPVGEYIEENSKRLLVVGVFKNFIIGSPYENINPMIVLGTKYWVYNVIMRFSPKNNMAANLDIAQKVFKKYNPAYPFTYHFVDDEYKQKFSDETQTATLSALFAGLTIFISCLGLFGLSAYMAETRAKEIGIRKVLGASLAGITKMLSKEFIVLVLIALMIAVPTGWWIMHNWLNSYTYRIQISWEIFAVTGIISIVIAVATVSFQSIKAAIENPVKSLRSE